jgi:hypothetical protein
MSVITHQLVRLSAVISCGFLFSSCVVSPPLPPPPGVVEEDGSSQPEANGPDENAPEADVPNEQSHNTPPPSAPKPAEYPVAKATDSPDRVISPYEPYNVIDVSGFHSGQLARDPSNRKIFRIP